MRLFQKSKHKQEETIKIKNEKLAEQILTNDILRKGEI